MVNSSELVWNNHTSWLIHKVNSCHFHHDFYAHETCAQTHLLTFFNLSLTVRQNTDMQGHFIAQCSGEFKPHDQFLQSLSSSSADSLSTSVTNQSMKIIFWLEREKHLSYLSKKQYLASGPFYLPPNAFILKYIWVKISHWGFKRFWSRLNSHYVSEHFKLFSFKGLH